MYLINIEINKTKINEEVIRLILAGCTLTIDASLVCKQLKCSKSLVVTKELLFTVLSNSLTYANLDDYLTLDEQELNEKNKNLLNFSQVKESCIELLKGVFNNSLPAEIITSVKEPDYWWEEPGVFPCTCLVSMLQNPEVSECSVVKVKSVQRLPSRKIFFIDTNDLKWEYVQKIDINL